MTPLSLCLLAFQEYTSPPNSDPLTMDASDYFLLFLVDDFFELLATETNRYAQQIIQSRQFPPNSRVHKWRDTTADEMKAFVGLLMAMGIDDRPTYSSYWSQDVVFGGMFWGSVMPRDRFLLLLKFMHFVNNDDQAIAGNRDKLYKIRPMIDLLNDKFQTLYSPQKDICVDETLVPWKGRLSFRQYIPIKPHKYGIKAST